MKINLRESLAGIYLGDEQPSVEDQIDKSDETTKPRSKPKRTLFQEQYIEIDTSKFKDEENPGLIYMGYEKDSDEQAASEKKKDTGKKKTTFKEKVQSKEWSKVKEKSSRKMSHKNKEKKNSYTDKKEDE